MKAMSGASALSRSFPPLVYSYSFLPSFLFPPWILITVFYKLSLHLLISLYMTDNMYPTLILPGFSVQVHAIVFKS